MDEYTYVCRECGAELESVRDAYDRGRWICPGCGAVAGVWLDGGTLDLEALRAEDPEPDPRFQILP